MVPEVAAKGYIIFKSVWCHKRSAANTASAARPIRTANYTASGTEGTTASKGKASGDPDDNTRNNSKRRDDCKYGSGKHTATTDAAATSATTGSATRTAAARTATGSATASASRRPTGAADDVPAATTSATACDVYEHGPTASATDAAASAADGVPATSATAADLCIKTGELLPAAAGATKTGATSAATVCTATPGAATAPATVCTAATPGAAARTTAARATAARATATKAGNRPSGSGGRTAAEAVPAIPPKKGIEDTFLSTLYKERRPLRSPFSFAQARVARVRRRPVAAGWGWLAFRSAVSAVCAGWKRKAATVLLGWPPFKTSLVLQDYH